MSIKLRSLLKRLYYKPCLRFAFIEDGVLVQPGIKRLGRAELGDLGADFPDLRFVVDVGDHAVDPAGDLVHLLVPEAARGRRRRADAHAAGDHRAEGLKRDGVAVDGDAGLVERDLRLFAGHAFAGQVDEDQVVVGAAGDEAEAFLHHLLGKVLAVADDVLLVDFELGLEGLGEGDGFRGDDVHEGAALHAGEDGGVEFFGVLFFAHDHAAAGARRVLWVVVVTKSQ